LTGRTAEVGLEIAVLISMSSEKPEFWKSGISVSERPSQDRVRSGGDLLIRYDASCVRNKIDFERAFFDEWSNYEMSEMRWRNGFRICLWPFKRSRYRELLGGAGVYEKKFDWFNVYRNGW
jgi:hypothetical protein